VIFRDLATTGDGILTGLQLLSVVVRRGQTLEALAAEAMEQLPQVLRNVRLPRRDDDLLELLAAAIGEVEAKLGASGRVLVRWSGTEPLLRVMVEAPTREQAESAADHLTAAAEAIVVP
jgi:phosphoglucosamine mutase